MRNRKLFTYFASLQLIPLFFFFPTFSSNAQNLETGKQLFLKNCAVCHLDGNNIIIPEKNLKKEALEENGMNTMTAITYQILNGKNGMPAFDERLNENEIELIANYILEESKHNFGEER